MARGSRTSRKNKQVFTKQFEELQQNREEQIQLACVEWMTETADMYRQRADRAASILERERQRVAAIAAAKIERLESRHHKRIQRRSCVQVVTKKRAGKSVLKPDFQRVNAPTRTAYQVVPGTECVAAFLV